MAIEYSVCDNDSNLVVIDTPLVKWSGLKFQSSESWVHIPPSGPVHMTWLVVGGWISHCNHQAWWTPLADGRTIPHML